MAKLKKSLFYLCLLILLSLVGGAAANEKLNIQGYFWGAQYFAKAKDEDKAISLYKKALELDPNFVDARYFLAKVYVKQDRLGEALTQLNMLSPLNYKDEAITAELRGINLEKEIEGLKKRMKEKEKELSKAVRQEELKSFSSPVYFEEGEIKVFRGEVDGIKLGNKILIKKEGKTVGKLEITKVSKFSSQGKIIELSPQISLKEGEKLGDQIIILP